MTKISEKIKRGEAVLADEDYTNKKVPLAVSIIAVITLVVCGICIPVLLGYIFSYVEDFIYGRVNENTTTYIILYTVFLVSLTSLIVCLIMSSIFLLRGKRRKCAITLDISAWSVGLAAITDIMLVGIKPETVALTLAIIALIVAKTYIDPTLAAERRATKKQHIVADKAEYDAGTIGRKTEGSGYAKFNYFNVLWIFVVFSILGYIWEAAWHMIVDDPGVYQERAGFLFGPFSPIYGLGGLLVSFICNKIHDKNPVVVFIVCAAIGGMFEFFVSWFLEMAFGIRSWDYSELPLNIDGRVSLRFFIMWGIIGFIYTKFAFKPLINGINKIPWKWRYGLTILLSIVVWGNAIMTLQALDCWYERAAGKEMNTPIEQFYNTYFNDEFMQARFQNMELNVDNAARSSAESEQVNSATSNTATQESQASQ